MLRENIIDKQRTASSMLRSEFMRAELQPKLNMIIKISIAHRTHKLSFDRLTTCKILFGLRKCGAEQNHQNIYHCSVVFMPPHSLPPFTA